MSAVDTGVAEDTDSRARSPSCWTASSARCEELAAGRPIVVVDDEDRENEGDLIFAASLATPEVVGFTIRYSSGVICVPLPAEDADRLNLPPMTAINQDRKGTAYTVSVDARDGVTTGISAADRARTIRLLADAATTADDLTRPGHVFPLRAKDGGVLVRAGHTEAAVDLCRLAGLPLAAGICEVVEDDGSMSRLPQLARFAEKHGLALISIADLIAYRRRTEKAVTRAAETRLPTAFGDFRAVGYRSDVDGIEHVALVKGEIGDGEDVLVRVHSECLTGDVFGSQRCDCGPQLHAALRAVDVEGRGVVLYMRGHEGRGIGLMHKLRAYELQERGPRHRGREPGAGPAGRRPRLRHRRADPGRPRRALHAAADQQPGQAHGAGGLRAAGDRPRAAAGERHPGQHPLPADQARPDGARPAGPGRGAGRRARGGDREAEALAATGRSADHPSLGPPLKIETRPASPVWKTCPARDGHAGLRQRTKE